MKPLAKIEYKGYEIHIHHDPDADNPRNWGPIGTMVCFHRRYNIGDEHDLRSDQFAGWGDMGHQLRKKYPVVLPIYMLDHSCRQLSTTPFNDPWDSGQIGYIYATRDSIKKALDIKHLTAKRRSQVEDYLVSEVAVYNDWMEGNVYGYQVYRRDDDGDLEDIDFDACWGYYGWDHDASGLLESAREAIDADINQLQPA